MADSACTATAYLSGVKTNYETIGVTAKVKLNDCAGSLAPGNRTQSIAGWSMDRGKAVGVVSTARVTHASPAGVYAHSANRNWESDTHMTGKADQCDDIAKQLVTGSPGKDIKVRFGNGPRLHRQAGHFPVTVIYRPRLFLFSLLIRYNSLKTLSKGLDF